MWDFLLERIVEWLFGKNKKGKETQQEQVEVVKSGTGKKKYFRLLDKNKSAKKNGNYLEALEYALEAIPHFKDVEGREDVQVIWPLAEASKYLPSVREGKAESRRIKKIISSDPKIGEDWVETVENISEKSEIMNKILELLDENPGFPQSNLWNQFDVDGRKWASRIDYAEQIGAIEKKKEGGKNKLYNRGKPSLKEGIM